MSQLLGIYNFNRSEYFEVVGTYTSPNYFAYNLSIGIICSALLFHYQFKKLKKYQPIIILFFNLLGIYLLFIAFSKAAFISLIIAFSFFLYKILKSSSSKYRINSKYLIILISISTLCGAFYYIFVQNEGSTNGRVLVAKITLNKMLKNPILGHGIKSFQRDYNLAKVDFIKRTNPPWDIIKNADYAYSAMNSFLEIAYETGIIAVLFLLLIIGVVSIKKIDDFFSAVGSTILVFFFSCAFFSSVFIVTELILFIVLAITLTYKKTDNCQYVTMKKHGNVLKAFLIIIFSLISTVGFAKIYALKTIQNANKNQEISKSISEKKLENLFLICSDKGFSEFYHGRFLYKKMNKKELGLSKMESSISKNIKPKHISYLANCFSKELNFEKAEELYELNTFTEPFKFKPKIDYLKLLVKSKQTEKACNYAKEIIDFPIKVPSKKVDEYKELCKKFIQKNSCN